MIGFLGKPSLFQALTAAKPSSPTSVAPSLGKTDTSLFGKKLLPESADFAGLFQSLVSPKGASENSAAPDSSPSLSQLRDLLAGLLSQVVGEPVEVAGAEEIQEGVLFFLQAHSSTVSGPSPDSSTPKPSHPAKLGTAPTQTADLLEPDRFVVFVPTASPSTAPNPTGKGTLAPSLPLLTGEDSQFHVGFRPLVQFLTEVVGNSSATSADSVLVGPLPAREPLPVRESFAGQPPLGATASPWKDGLFSAKTATPGVAEPVAAPSSGATTESTFQKPASGLDLPSSLLKLFVPPAGTGIEEAALNLSTPESFSGSSRSSENPGDSPGLSIPKDWLVKWMEKTEDRVVRDLGLSLAGGNRKGNDTSFLGFRPLGTGTGQTDLLRDLGIRFARIQTVSAQASGAGLIPSPESPSQESLLALRVGQTLTSVAPKGLTATVHSPIPFELPNVTTPLGAAGASAAESAPSQEPSTLENLMPAKLASLLSREPIPSRPAIEVSPEGSPESPEPADVLQQDPLAKPEPPAPKTALRLDRGLETLLPRMVEKRVSIELDSAPPATERVTAPAAPVQPATSTPAVASTSTSQPGPGVQESAILDQVAKVLKTPETQRGTEIRLRLVPESLGEMHIRIGMKEGVLTAEFRASSELTREILTRDSHHLQNLLAQSGLRAEHVVIRTGNLGGENSSSLYSQERESSQTAQKESGSRQGNGQENRGNGSQEGNPQGRNRHKPSLWDRWEQLF